jgi:hypothetical protein
MVELLKLYKEGISKSFSNFPYEVMILAQKMTNMHWCLILNSNPVILKESKKLSQRIMLLAAINNSLC